MRHVPLSELETLLILTVDERHHRLALRHHPPCPLRAARSPTTTAAPPDGRSRRPPASTPRELFYTDDSGLYFLPTRDAGALVDPAEEEVTLELMLERHRARVREAVRRAPPPAPPGAVPGGTQHLDRQRARLAAGDPGRRHRPAPHRQPLLLHPERLLPATTTSTSGRSRASSEFADLVDLERADPALVRRAVLADRGHRRADDLQLQRRAAARRRWAWAAGRSTASSTWRCSARPAIRTSPGSGFRYDTDPRWGTPNPTGRTDGTFHAFCPPHFATMAAAVEAFCERKFGPGGPYHPDTPGAWTRVARRPRLSAASRRATSRRA